MAAEIYAKIQTLVEKNPELKRNDALLVLYFWYFFDEFPILLPKQRASRLTPPAVILNAKNKLYKNAIY
ncbi:MAG: hypothetical protein QW625_02400 [Candidatus Nanoarchaeia archaeon]